MEAIRYRDDIVDGSGDPARIVDDYFPGRLLPEIGKLLQHFRCCAQIKGRLMGSIRIALPCQEDLPVDAIFRIQEMDIPRGYNWKTELSTEAYDLLV